MGQWTTLLGKLDNLIMQQRQGTKGSGSVHEKPGELVKAASLWILCTTLTARLQKTNLFLVLMESLTQVIPLTLECFQGTGVLPQRKGQFPTSRPVEISYVPLYSTLLFYSIQVLCPHRCPDQVPTHPGNPLLLPLLWFPITFPVPHDLFFLFNIDYYDLNAFSNLPCSFPQNGRLF